MEFWCNQTHYIIIHNKILVTVDTICSYYHLCCTMFTLEHWLIDNDSNTMGYQDETYTIRKLLIIYTDPTSFGYKMKEL